MDCLKNYVIRVSGLKQGVHRFSFEIDEKFFDAFEYSEIKRGQVNVDVLLEKKERILTLNLNFSGHVEVFCDRCSDKFDHALSGNKHLIMKVGDDGFDDSEDVIVISEDEYEVNISQYLYEFVILLLPVKRLHKASISKNDRCNSDVLEYLETQSRSDKAEDPRWEALKALKDKMNK